MNRLKKGISILSKILCAMLWLYCLFFTPIMAKDLIQAASEQIDYIKAAELQNIEIRRVTEVLTSLENTLPDAIKSAVGEDATSAELSNASIALDKTNSSIVQVDSRVNSLKTRLDTLSKSLDALNSREQILSNPVATGTLEQKSIELANIALQSKKIQDEQIKINDYLGQLKSHKSVLQKIQVLQSNWLTKLQTLSLSRLEQEKSTQKLDGTENAENIKSKNEKELSNLVAKLSGPDLTDQARKVTSLTIDTIKINQSIKELNNEQEPIIASIKILEQLLSQKSQSSDAINTAIESLKNNTKALKQTNKDWLGFDSDLDQITQTVAEIKVGQKDASVDKTVFKPLQNLEDELLAAKTLFSQLKQNNKDALSKISTLNDKVGELARNIFNTELTHYVAWPSDKQEFKQVLQSLRNSPSLFINQIKESIKVGINSFQMASYSLKMTLIGLEIAIFLFGIFSFFVMRIFLAQLQKSGAIFQYRATQNFLTLINNNILSITVAALLILPLIFFKIPEPGNSILLIINLSWLMLKLPLSICYLLMVKTPHTQQRDPSLFRLILLSVITGGIISICIYMAGKLNLPTMEIDTLKRVFLLWLLFMQWPLICYRQYICRIFWTQATQEANAKTFMLSTLIYKILRISIFFTGLIGLIGFINLATLLIEYAAIFIAISICWILSARLLGDIVHFIKEWAMINTKMGILWAQDIIDPIYKLLRICLFLYVWLVLPVYIGLDKSSALATWFNALINAPLFSLGNTGLSIKHLVIAIFLIVSVFSFARWLRAVAFRWILSNVTDTGIRHSLSVFIQYVVVIIGFIIMLNFLSIDLTTLTVFAGALGVGIGFGLQTIANNLVSGILLLIERPLRTGDIVEIANQTGVIDRIGIRSITMRTFDRSDVIIPNSSVISGSFVNWTHQNNDRRSVLIIGVGYSAPPEHVMALFNEIVKNQNGVLIDQPVSVLLDDFAASAINYKISYFVDIDQSSQGQIKSDILLKIYQVLAEYNYDLPYPQQVVHLKKDKDFDLQSQQVVHLTK